MEVEVSAEAKDKRLNRLVAITVVTLSVFMGLCNIKDGNIVQAMDQSKANSIDTWNEYQATKIKLHGSQDARAQLAVLEAEASGPAKAGAAAHLAGLDADIAKYEQQYPGLRKQAEGDDAQYDALNVHDDQFDAAEALLATAISIAAVAALVDNLWVLVAAWVFGAGGVFMGICGFARLGFHPDVLSKFLG
jgi:hypothetical protein